MDPYVKLKRAPGEDRDLPRPPPSMRGGKKGLRGGGGSGKGLKRQSCYLKTFHLLEDGSEIGQKMF